MGGQKVTSVLIFGATGFIGTNLVNYFCQNTSYDLICVSNSSSIPSHLSSNINWIQLDLRDRSSIKSLPLKVDHVLQFAASTSAGNSLEMRKLSFIHDNILINSNILHYVATSDVRHFIFPSCSTIYQSSLSPVREDEVDLNIPFYSSYKGSANVKSYVEQICKIYSELLQTNFSIIRHSNLYGPYDKFFRPDSHVCASLISKVLLAPDNGCVEIWGDGNLKRDLLYISDFCDAVNLLMNSQLSKFDIFNIGSSRLVSIDSLAMHIMSLAKKNLKFTYTSSLSTSCFTSILDTAKFSSMYNWFPKYTLHDGLYHTLDWLNSHYN